MESSTLTNENNDRVVYEDYFIDISQVEKREYGKNQYIKTMFTGIDRNIKGLGMGQASIVSGINGSAKSTFCSQLLLNTIEQGSKVAIFSGELPNYKVLEWLKLQSAGKDNVFSEDSDHIIYKVDKKIETKIEDWLRGKVYIHRNNDYSAVTLGKAIIDLTRKDKEVKLVIIDNLMMLNLSQLSADKIEAQTQLILKMTALAKIRDIHIIFVCHPTKSKGFIRKEDISGSGNIVNAVDNVFICHRNNSDFRVRSKEFFGWDEGSPIYQFSNVIEICKNRDFGVQDKMLGFHFDTTCKRFLNEEGENILYGWKQKSEDITMIPIASSELDNVF